MKIILMKDISGVGKRYETKEIAEGYALNFLVPKGLALVATPDVVKRIGIEKAKIDGEKKVHEELLMKNLKGLDGATITMTEKANEKGALFAGIHKAELIPAIEKQTRLQIAPEFIILEKPIKTTGDHAVEIKIGDKKARFTLKVVAK